MMRAMLHVGLVAAAAALLGFAGCKGEEEQISTAHSLLARQHRIWENARQTLRTDNPNWDLLASVSVLIGVETPMRMQKDYSGANRDEVVAKLKELHKAFQAQILSKLDLSGARAKPIVPQEEIRAAFDKLDKDYQQLKEMTD